MKSAIVSLTRMVAGIALLTTSLHAALITFTAGNDTVPAGGNVSVPITVSSQASDPYTYWGNAGFHLTWDSTVLTLQATPVDLTGSPLLLGLGNFGTASGQLSFTWNYQSLGTQVPDGSTLFSVKFTATGAAGSSTALNFTTVANIGLLNADASDFIITTPDFVIGEVEVVPEPVNCALACLACVFIGARTLRWISTKRSFRQPF